MSVNRDHKITGVEVLAESEKALHLRHAEYGMAWFPKSHAMVTPKGTLWCSKWIAEQKGWDSEAKHSEGEWMRERMDNLRQDEVL